MDMTDLLRRLYPRGPAIRTLNADRAGIHRAVRLDSIRKAPSLQDIRQGKDVFAPNPPPPRVVYQVTIASNPPLGHSY